MFVYVRYRGSVMLWKCVSRLGWREWARKRACWRDLYIWQEHTQALWTCRWSMLGRGKFELSQKYFEIEPWKEEQMAWKADLQMLTWKLFWTWVFLILTQLKGGRSVLMIGCPENVFHRNGPYYSPWNSLEGLLTHCKRLEVHLTIKVPPTARNLMDFFMCRLIQGLSFIQSNLWEQGQGP